MRNSLPTSGHDLPCGVPKFTGIRAAPAKPAYSVYQDTHIEQSEMGGSWNFQKKEKRWGGGGGGGWRVQNNYDSNKNYKENNSNVWPK